ncbi:MAG TPA: M28 family peptidase [Burkholderiaceae bacterium]
MIRILLLASLALAAPLHAQTVKEAPLRGHLAMLADDLFEGRGTGQRGGGLAVRYLETQSQVLGLLPVGGNSYRQAVPLIGAFTQTGSQPGDVLRFEAAGKPLPAVFGRDVAFATGTSESQIAFDAPVVFVGYGIRADEEKWNDYKNVDVKGKFLIMLVNDPQPTAGEPNRFGGKSLTWYGRWVYKFEQAKREGAAGVLLVHTTPSASYDWSVASNSFIRERFHLDAPGNKAEGWIHENAARALFAAAGQDLDVLRAKAETREFEPVTLNATAHFNFQSKIRRVTEFNVIGMVPGTDPKLKDEAVIYSAHWDGFGKIEGKNGDQIWNGAVDNATGTAALLAMAQAAVAKPAKRTQIFFWPAAEEQGLLGSAAYVRTPPWPLAKTTADLNLDSMNFVGATRDMGVAGSERSSLHALAAGVAKQMKLKLAPSVPDLGGSYFRADHFNFARAGVPAFNVGSAVFSGDGSFEFEHDHGGGTAKMKSYPKHYHQVSDQYDPNWDLAGMVQQAQFTLNLGYAVANAPSMQTWKAGEAFGKVKR